MNFLTIAGLLFLASAVAAKAHKNYAQLHPECGKMLRQNPFVDVEETGLPWTALLGSKNGEAFCPGSLISDEFVLTTANCVRQSPTHVHLGVYDRNCLDYGNSTEYPCKGISVPVRSMIEHEDYPLVYAKVGWLIPGNIALVRLAEKVEFNDYIGPICLPSHDPANDASLMVAGWCPASTSQQPNLKTYNEVKVENEETALKVCEDSGWWYDEYFCVTNKAEEKRICGAEDGSALIGYETKLDGSTRLTAYGIWASGSDPEQLTSAFFARVRDYMPWIIRKLEQAD